MFSKSQAANQKPGNLEFCAPFNERILIGLNSVGISKKREKEWIRQKLKVSRVDIQILRSVFRVLNFNNL